MISKNKSIKTIILLGCLWLSLNAYLFPLIWHNGAGVGYVDPGPKQSISTNPIETLIVSAAGYYLDASSNIKQVLMQIELQDANGLNTTTLNSSLDSAIKNIQKAKELYGQLVTQAENSLYNPDVIKALSQFNYGDFCTKEALNTTVFAEVSLFLKNGDITGLLKRTLENITRIETLLNNLKAELFTDQTTATQTALKLNDTNAQLLLFGSYVARVFAAI